MNCIYHKKEAVSKCKVCGAPLCDECEEFQNKNGCCEACARDLEARTYKTQKSGLMYNILSLVCAIGFLVLYIISFSKLLLPYKIAGGIIIGILLPLTVIMLIFTLRSNKKSKNNINIANLDKIKKSNKE